jgi:hypothetical protein
MLLLTPNEDLWLDQEVAAVAAAASLVDQAWRQAARPRGGIRPHEAGSGLPVAGGLPNDPSSSAADSGGLAWGFQ